MLWRALKLPHLIKRDYQLVHCHLKVSWIYAIVLCVGFKVHKNTKFIFHEHDPEIANLIWYDLLLKLAVKFGIVVVVSDFMRKLLIPYGIPTDKLLTLRNFVDIGKFSPKRQRPMQPNDRKILVGFVGRLVKRKGWEDIIVLAEILKNQGVVFQVIGSGDDAAPFHQTIKKKGLGDVIRIEGPTRDVPKILQSIDLLVMPSLLESSGLVHLEAQASGVPVIAYNIPGVDEMISHDNSILVPFGQVDLMAERILDLIRSPKSYDNLVTKGLENAREHSLDSYMLKLERLYSDQFPSD